MRYRVGCLLPVLRSPLLLEEETTSTTPRLLPQICRAEVISQFPEGSSSSHLPVDLRQSSALCKRKRSRRSKDVVGRSSHGENGAIREDYSVDSEKGPVKKTFLCTEEAEGHAYSCSTEEKDLEKGLVGTTDGLDCARITKFESTDVRAKDKEAQKANGECTEYASYLRGLDDETALRCLAFVSLSDHHRLAMVARRYRRLVKSSLLFELRRTYKVVEQWVCIYASGDNGWTAFDPKQKVWRNLPPANVDPVFSLSDRESLSAGSHLLWLGREVFDFACYKYDLITNCWERGPPMVNSRCLFASASCGEFAFVAGGFRVGEIVMQTLGKGLVLNTAERYDARLGKWEPLPSMETARQKCSGVFMDGKFYVLGGKDKDHNTLSSGEVYDPVSKTWTIIPDMYIPPETEPSFEPSPPLLAVANNELYAIESSTNLLKGYVKSSNSWKVLGPVPVRTDVCNGWGLAFKALGDELFVIGSYQIPSSREGVAVFSWKPQLDAAALEWRLGAPPPEWRMVNLRVRGSGSFLYNCAVMSC